MSGACGHPVGLGHLQPPLLERHRKTDEPTAGEEQGQEDHRQAPSLRHVGTSGQTVVRMNQIRLSS